MDILGTSKERVRRGVICGGIKCDVAVPWKELPAARPLVVPIHKIVVRLVIVIAADDGRRKVIDHRRDVDVVHDV